MKMRDKIKVSVLTIISFLLSLQLGFTTFIDSSYLSSLLSDYVKNPDSFVGYIYAIASLISLFGIYFLPKFLKRYGNFKIMLLSTVLLPISLCVLYTDPGIKLSVIFYLLSTLSATLIFASADVFLPHYVPEEEGGYVRGFYFALLSLGFMISPAIAGYLVEYNGLNFVYLMGVFCTIPLAPLSYFAFRKFKDSIYESVPLFPNKALFKKAKDLMPVFWSHFALQSFYAIMTIYAPLYFVENIGLSRDKFGLILTIALSTFVIFPTYLGYIADKYIGEKEMIVVGVILMGLSLFSIPFIAMYSVPLYVWGIIILISRIGATLTESMTDIFFFKKIEHSHPSLIAFYRRARPLALLTVPALFAILLSTKIIDISQVFMISGFAIVLSVVFPLRLIDTK